MLDTHVDLLSQDATTDLLVDKHTDSTLQHRINASVDFVVRIHHSMERIVESGAVATLRPPKRIVLAAGQKAQPNGETLFMIDRIVLRKAD